MICHVFALYLIKFAHFFFNVNERNRHIDISWCIVLISFGLISLLCIYIFLICIILIINIFHPYIGVYVVDLNSGNIFCIMTKQRNYSTHLTKFYVIPRGSSFEVEIVKMIYLKTIIPTSSTPRHILLIIQILLVHWDVMLWVASLLLCIT